MSSERFMWFLTRSRSLTWPLHSVLHEPQNKYAHIVKDNTRHSNIPKNLHSMRLNKILHPPSNMPSAFSGTALAPKIFFIKYFSCLFVVFLLYDFNSHEILWNALSPIATNGISPELPRATFWSGITDPPIISLYIEADFNKRTSRVALGAPTVSCKNRFLWLTGLRLLTVYIFLKL